MKGFFNAVKWEIILDMKECIRYRLDLIMDFVIFTGTFVIVYFLKVSDGFTAFYNVNANSGNMLVFIGYIFWQNASTALGYSSGIISNESSRGIFEVRLQGKFPVEAILFFRLLASCIIHLGTYVGILGFGVIILGCQVRDLLFMLLAIAISIPCLVGMYGIGLLFGSVCIREKNISSFVMVVQTLLLFVTNTLSPSRNKLVYIIPFSCGIDIMRNLYLGIPVSGTLIATYTLVNLIWLAIGVICFQKAIKREKTRGSFDNY